MGSDDDTIIIRGKGKIKSALAAVNAFVPGTKIKRWWVAVGLIVVVFLLFKI